MRMRARKRTRWLVSRILLCILLGVSLATVVITGRFWWQQQANHPPGSAATAEALKEKLEFYDKRADELERLLTLLLGVSTIYAIALGVSAYQQLKDSADNLKTFRKEAEKEIDEFVVKVESKFPLFADMDIAIRAIMDQLTRLLPVTDWSDEDYLKLKDQERQEIFFYEKTVASLECFDLQRNRDIRGTISEIYHGLGNFYGLRSASVSKASKDSADKLGSLRKEAEKEIEEFVVKVESKSPLFVDIGIAFRTVMDRLMLLLPKIDRSDEDRERARFYLDRAIRHDAENTGALNDRAFLAVYLDTPPDIPKAKMLFSKSLEADPGQQRARYDLAYIEHGDKKYGRSEQLLSEALLMKRWQDKLPARNRNDILYNRACAYARLDESEKALTDLEEVFPVGVDYSAELVTHFKDDTQSNGDLSALTSTEPWGTRIGAIRDRLP